MMAAPIMAVQASSGVQCSRHGFDSQMVQVCYAEEVQWQLTF